LQVNRAAFDDLELLFWAGFWAELGHGFSPFEVMKTPRFRGAMRE
jgi:hypothetical protein